MEDRLWFRSYDPEVPRELDYPETPLFAFLDESAKKYPDNACTIFQGARVTYREMAVISTRLALSLARLGVKQGDRVGIFMPNTPQFVMAFFAVLRAGGVVVAINPLSSPREIEQQLTDAGVAVILVMSNYYELLKSLQSKTKVRTLLVTNVKEAMPGVQKILFALTRERPGGFKVNLSEGDYWMADLIKGIPDGEGFALEVRPDDPAVIQYSGGTTGAAKAVVILHRNLVANTIQLHHWFVGIEEGKEVMLMAIPLFHVYGMVAGMGLAVHLGAGMVMVPDPRNFSDLLSSIDRYQATLFPGVPTLFRAINQNPKVIAGSYKLTSIKGCISGSAPLPPETRERFVELTGSRLFEGYGLSEAPTATHCLPINGETKAGSIGLPLPGVDARIVDIDEGSTTLPPGETGELVVRGPQVMKGYLNLPEETANAIRDGWLYTGDIAYMDEQGYFYIVDRKKELIKPGGFQVWPSEVEAVIRENPTVLDVGVAGVPDDYRGETVKAWVVLKAGETMTEEEIREWCRSRLARYKVPTSVEFRDHLPKNQLLGKLLRRELVREHLERSKLMGCQS